MAATTLPANSPRLRVRVSKKGEVTSSTHCVAGADCIAASAFIENAIGKQTGEKLTAEYYQNAPLEQHVEMTETQG